MFIFSANENHTLKGHPERPDRILKLKEYLTQRYTINTLDITCDFTQAISIFNKYYSAYHKRLITNGFDDINSAYSVEDQSFIACINEIQCIASMISADIPSGFLMIRPPGHHCHDVQPGGFCLINTAYITACELLEKHPEYSMGIILDIDLHHGGGTQKHVEENNKLGYYSIHSSGTWSDGLIEEKNGHHTTKPIWNVALNYADDTIYLEYIEKMLQDMKEYSPDFLVLSAGFDAHKAESKERFIYSPEFELSSQCYGKIMSLCRKYFDKIIIVLEGGYSIKGITESVEEMYKVIID